LADKHWADQNISNRNLVAEPICVGGIKFAWAVNIGRDFVMDEHRIREIYQISLDTNRATFAEGEYDIAYHLLLVALQCALRLMDIEYLTEITRLAEKESRFIDDHHPEYPYSSKAAIQRGTFGLFQTAAQKARAIIRTKNGNGRGHFA